MDIANFFGLSPILREGADGEGTGGGTGSSVSVADTSGSVDLAVTGGEGGDTSVATTDADAAPATTGPSRAYEGGKLTKTFADGITALRATHPQVSKAAATALAVVNKLYNMGLGAQPLKTIEGLKNFHREVGGVKGLEAYRAQSADVDAQDALYAAGDPALLRGMTHVQNKSGEWVPNPPAVAAFAKLVPHAMEMLQKFSPNRHIALASKAIVSTMNTLRFNTGRKTSEGQAIMEPLNLPYRMMRFNDVLSAITVTDGVATIPVAALSVIKSDAGALTGFVEYLCELPNTEPEDLTPKVDPNAERLELEKGKQQLAVNQMLAARKELQNESYRTAWRELNIATRATPAQQQQIESQFKVNIDVARRGMPDNIAKMDSFFDAKDVAGYTRYHQNFFNDKVPKILGKIVKEVLGTKPAAQVVATTTTTVPAAGATALAAQAGKVAAVKGRPETNDMKRGPGGSTMDMFSKKQFIASKTNRWKVPEGTRCTWAE